MREEEYRKQVHGVMCCHPDGGQTDRRLGGLLGLLGNHDFLTAIFCGMEGDLLGWDTATASDIDFLLHCVAEAKQEAFKLCPVKHYHGEIGGELALLNKIEESLLQYRADSVRLALEAAEMEAAGI